MKKILFLSLVVLMGFSAMAQEPATAATAATNDAGRVKFFYYPSTNIYYNEATSEYLHYDDATSTWLTVKQLPTTVVVEPTAMKYAVYYNGNEIWKENAAHKTKYKVKKDGTVKEKSKDDRKDMEKDKKDAEKEKVKD
jgi:hypothetical protein